MTEMRAAVWLVTAFGDDRQYAGNTGYHDEVTTHYRFDSNVPNHKKVRTGDLFVVRSKESVLGVARVERLTSTSGPKVLRLCPRCRRSGLKRLSVKSPSYRCHSCGHEFSDPVLKRVAVSNFTAEFGRTFVPCVMPIVQQRFREACPHYNGQHAMQRCELGALGHYGASLRVAAGAARSGRLGAQLLKPTADAVELEWRVNKLLENGSLPRPPGQKHPRRVRSGEVDAFLRDPNVKAWVLRTASGVCEACRRPGPFVANGARFLEVHHVVPLAAGGPDVVSNAVAVCPNCHRALHLASNRGVRVQVLRTRIRRLRIARRASS